MGAVQMNLWEVSNPEGLNIELETLRLRQDNLRKSIFQRLDILKKEIEALKAEVGFIQNTKEIITSKKQSDFS